MATLILALLWSMWFTGYIFAWFLVKPVEDWKSISDYSHEPSTAPIAMHWIGKSSQYYDIDGIFCTTRLIPFMNWHLDLDLPAMPLKIKTNLMINIGGIIVMLTGPFQLMQSVRTKWPRLHRWMGRIYLLFGCLVASVAGLVYIILNGTVGTFQQLR